MVAEAEARGVLADKLESPRFRLALYAGSALGVCVGCALFLTQNFLGFQVWALASAVFLFAMLKRSHASRGWLARFLHWLGTFSFSLYIIHVPLVVVGLSVLRHSARHESILFFYGMLSFVVLSAYLFSLAFERPALRLSQKYREPR